MSTLPVQFPDALSGGRQGSRSASGSSALGSRPETTHAALGARRAPGTRQPGTTAILDEPLTLETDPRAAGPLLETAP